MIEDNTFKKLSVILAFIALLILTALVTWQIATSIATGLILAYIFYPIYTKIAFVIREKNISAILTILLVTFIVFLPVWIFLPMLLRQIFDFYLFMQTFDVFGLIQRIFPVLTQSGISQDIATSLNSFISNVVSKTLESFSEIFLNFPVFALKAVVVLFVLFFGMRDAELFTDYVKSLSPFSKTTEKDMSEKFKDITSAVIKGYILVGILQGILTGIGLLIFKVPHPLPLTIAAMFTSIIPILGAWVIWVPAALYLFAKGNVVFAVALAIYGGLFVSQIDNVIRPYIIARKTKISSAIVLVGMIGGLLVFGVLGLILGPLILSYLLLVLDAYRNKRFPGLFES